MSKKSENEKLSLIKSTDLCLWIYYGNPLKRQTVMNYSGYIGRMETMNIYMKIMRIVVTVCMCLFVALLLSHPSYGGTNLEIWHDPPTCAVTDSPIKISANIISPTLPKEARIYFKKQGPMSYYFVQMKQETGGIYTGIIPAPMETTMSIEYLILIVDRNENLLTSPPFSVLINKELECPKSMNIDWPNKIVVYAEHQTSPEIGFSGENVQWNVSHYFGKPYLNKAMNVQMESYSPEQEQGSFSSVLDKRTAVRLGLGIGALVVAGVVISKIGGESPPDIVAELIKVPNVQTSCGTIVTNQLYVTNKKEEPLTIGSIDYEVELTRDRPAGSCGEGRIGTFAPNWAIEVQPGETALIREWSNEVNPCSDCPYLIAECQWRSQYIVHTSAGDAVAKSTFTAEGDLCGTPSAKSFDGDATIKGDIEP